MYSELSYHILGSNSAFYPEENKLRNDVYTAWHSLWSEIYGEAKSGYELNSDEFTRQKIVTAILHNDKIAGVHLYSFFHLDSMPDLHTQYFHFFSPQYLQLLRDRNVQTVMSMEFLTVMPDFRKSKLGLSIGLVISQLGTEIFRASGVDAIVAPARNDVGVNKMAYDIGFSCLEKDTQQRGFVCDLIACFKGQQKPSESKEVRVCADVLWERKKIYQSASKQMWENQTTLPSVAA